MANCLNTKLKSVIDDNENTLLRPGEYRVFLKNTQGHFNFHIDNTDNPIIIKAISNDVVVNNEKEITLDTTGTKSIQYNSKYGSEISIYDNYKPYMFTAYNVYIPNIKSVIQSRKTSIVNLQLSYYINDYKDSINIGEISSMINKWMNYISLDGGIYIDDKTLDLNRCIRAIDISGMIIHKHTKELIIGTNRNGNFTADNRISLMIDEKIAQGIDAKELTLPEFKDENNLNRVNCGYYNLQGINIKNVANFNQSAERFNLQYSNVSGNLAVLHNARVFNQGDGCLSYSYITDGLTYSGERSCQYILRGTVKMKTKNDADALLIGESTKELGEYSLHNATLTILAPGGRTSLSDSAITILTSKGMSVIIIDSDSGTPSVYGYSQNTYKVIYKDYKYIIPVEYTTFAELNITNDYKIEEFETLEEANDFIKMKNLIFDKPVEEIAEPIFD